jgi:hypothetical protein
MEFGGTPFWDKPLKSTVAVLKVTWDSDRILIKFLTYSDAPNHCICAMGQVMYIG